MTSARLIVVALMLCSARALACGCSWPGYAAAMDFRSVAFEGVPEGDAHEFPFWNEYGFVVRVTRVFKGSVAPKVLVTTQASSCGHLMKPGTPYVFVIYPDFDGVLSYRTHGCDGTAPMAELTADDLAVLGSGKPPTPRLLQWPALFLYGFLALAGVWLRRMRKLRAK